MVGVTCLSRWRRLREHLSRREAGFGYVRPGLRGGALQLQLVLEIDALGGVEPEQDLTRLAPGSDEGARTTGDGPRDLHPDVGELIAVAADHCLTRRIAEGVELRGDNDGPSRGAQAFPNEPAPANPFPEDLVREFGRAVGVDAITLTECSSRIDVAASDEARAITRHPVAVGQIRIEDEMGAVLGDIKTQHTVGGRGGRDAVFCTERGNGL